jgi:hypothetical protein
MSLIQRAPDADGIWREKVVGSQPLDGLPMPLAAWWPGWQLFSAYRSALLRCINQDASPSVSPIPGVTGQALVAGIIAAGVTQTQLCDLLYDQSGNARHLAAPSTAEAPRVFDFATQTLEHENLSLALDFPTPPTARTLTRADALGLTGDPALTIAWKGRFTPQVALGPNVLALGSAAAPELCLFGNTLGPDDLIGITSFDGVNGASWYLPANTLSALHSYVITKPATGYTGATWNLYVDGVSAGVPTQLAAAAVVLANELTQLGDVPGGGYAYDGTLEGLLVWGSVLDATQLATLQTFLDSV